MRVIAVFIVLSGVPEQEDADVIAAVLDGRPPDMPVFANYFTNQEIADITAYVRDAFGGA